jgi:hypothetical protein
MFHIRNAPPGDLAAVLATLGEYPKLSTVSEVVEQAEKLGFIIQDRQRLEALITARDLGFVHQKRNTLTDKGQIIAQLERYKPDLFVDIVHSLLYTLWDSREKEKVCFSWSYRAICETLWSSGSGNLASRRDLTSEIEAQARTTFSRPTIAFSPKSVGGALLWLSELSPAVLNEDETRFSRRVFCPPELFVMAIDFIYRMQEMDYGVNLLLSDENREAICQVCLLEPERFDRVLEYAVAQFDYLHKGIGGGWGQYLALDRGPRMEEFI